MKITADTNVLVRALTSDDPRQSQLARETLTQAELVAVPLPALCEVVWVLTRGYRIPMPEIADAIRRLANAANVAINQPAVEAGLAILEAGGDFADGVIAYEGAWLGADTFVSFDKKATRLIEAQGGRVSLLAS